VSVNFHWNARGAQINCGTWPMTEERIVSAIAEPETLPFLAPDALAEFGSTVVIAPHPDDESLGCGGLISLLVDFGLPVRVVIVSDGVGSHRNSKTFPQERLRTVRQQEAIEAVETLGVKQESLAFLNLPDQHVPFSGLDGFSEAVDACVGAMTAREFIPETIVLPWRRDPHCDHESSWQIGQAASVTLERSIRTLEYTIWLAELGEPHEWPDEGEVQAWRVDISTVLDRKRAAIACHRSQTTDLIDDDPSGFRLSPETLTRFDVPWEIYLEPRHGQ
jgi:LmbE family N-acetylglucosaminyl deacetylase